MADSFSERKANIEPKMDSAYLEVVITLIISTHWSLNIHTSPGGGHTLITLRVSREKDLNMTVLQE